MQLESLEERCKLPQRVRAEHGRKRLVVHFELKRALLVTAIILKFSVKQVANL